MTKKLKKYQSNNDTSEVKSISIYKPADPNRPPMTKAFSDSTNKKLLDSFNTGLKTKQITTGVKTKRKGGSVKSKKKK